jgi:hypothetical protein
VKRIIERIEREAGAPGLAETLAGLPPTDLQSLLLEVYRLRAERRAPASLLADHESNRFVRPSPGSPAALLTWERVAFAHLPPEFEALALSPVAPLGAASAVAAVDQNWAVATCRNTEVVSDSTNVLALECALKRRQLLRRDGRSSTPVHLAASHRLLRGQNYNRPGMSAHFSAFALSSAGRDRGHLGFELAALELHLRFYLSALATYLGSGIPLRVAVTSISPESTEKLLETGLIEPLSGRFPGVEFLFDPERRSGRGYYVDACFHIYAITKDRTPMELVDGGCVGWTRRLLSNAKERLVISGIGSERLVSEFPRAGA